MDNPADFLAAVDDESREHFNAFADALFEDYFDSREEHNHQVNHVIVGRRAALAPVCLSVFTPRPAAVQYIHDIC